MLIPLIIEKKKKTFGVILDKENNKFLFEGQSIPENTIEFFKPIFDWLNEYKKTPLEETIVNMNFEYYNTATSMLLLDVFRIFDEINKKGKPVKIVWHYLEGDVDIKEAGEDYESILNLSFEFIKRPEYYYKKEISTKVLFNPINILALKAKNRIVMAPMCTYKAIDGFANNWHAIHYSSRAIGQVGTIIVEATAIEPKGRISEEDLGIWDDKYIDGLKTISTECKKEGAVIGIQISHAGRKSKVWNDGVVAPTPLAFSSGFPTPHELTIKEIDTIIKKFGQAAKRADKAGFDFVEIHAAHGYLINQFLSSVTNYRKDKYGKDKKLFLERVLKEIRANFPDKKAIFLRVSAEEYHPKGNNPEKLGNLLSEIRHLFNILHVSSGGIDENKNFPVYPGYELEFASYLKNKLQIPVIAVGLLHNEKLANYALIEEKADFIALGRALLSNPYWPLHAAKKLNIEIEWPKPYVRAKEID